MECPDRPKSGQSSIFRIFDHERHPDQSKYLDLSPIKRSVARCHEVMNVWRYEEWAGNLRISRATGTVPERVQSRVHTTEPTRPVPELFHCDHIARWSARSGTTGRSGTGVNTGARLRSETVPVSKLWCEHGLCSAVQSYGMSDRIGQLFGITDHVSWSHSSKDTEAVHIPSFQTPSDVSIAVIQWSL